jgi:hypothetical protein
MPENGFPDSLERTIETCVFVNRRVMNQSFDLAGKIVLTQTDVTNVAAEFNVIFAAA